MDIFGKIDIASKFDEIEQKYSVVYKDSMTEPWGRPDKSTRSQIVAWDFIQRRQGHGPLVALLGAKGSGKTHLGGAFALHMAQVFPGSLGCLISNTYQQAKDNGTPHLINASSRLEIPIEFFKEKKIGGRPYSSVFVLDLDGTGFESGKCSYVLLRTFEAVNKLEGIELDWLWVEEIQDAEKEDFATVFSRVRGQNADNAVFIAGMPRDEFHWQYTYLPQLGFIEEAQHTDETNFAGIMLEPSLMENIKNVGQKYLDRLMATYDEQLATWYIEGKRTSLNTNKVLYNYGDYVHRQGRMSKILAKYDKHLPILVSFDFNVAPMSVTLWQVKRWNDKWDGDNVMLLKDGTVRVYDKATDIRDANAEYADFPSLDAYAPADRDVLSQIDEFEVWSGGTEGACKEICKKYADHEAGGTVLGDATGNRQDTRSSTTDWQIIRKWFKRLPHFAVVQGLMQNSNYKTGEVKYSNPPRRDTINVANKLLRDARGVVRICFLPKSKYKSGGVARSCALAQNKPDGNIDESNDRKEGKDVPRLHFFDTFRYVCWYFNGGDDGVSAEEFDELANDIDFSASFAGGIGGSSAFGF